MYYQAAEIDMTYSFKKNALYIINHLHDLNAIRNPNNMCADYGNIHRRISKILRTTRVQTGIRANPLYYEHVI